MFVRRHIWNYFKSKCKFQISTGLCKKFQKGTRIQIGTPSLQILRRDKPKLLGSRSLANLKMHISCPVLLTLSCCWYNRVKCKLCFSLIPWFKWYFLRVAVLHFLLAYMTFWRFFLVEWALSMINGVSLSTFQPSFISFQDFTVPKIVLRNLANLCTVGLTWIM